MLKRLVLGGWLIPLIGAGVVIMLPNNKALAETLWVFSLCLFVATLVFVCLVAVRLFTRLLERPRKSVTAENSALPAPVRVRQRMDIKVMLLSIAAIALLVISIFAFIEYKIRSSSVYQAAMAKAYGSPFVIERLGQPIESGWFNSGEITESSNGSGRANLMIPISGPKGRGKLKVYAVRTRGNWQFSSLAFVGAGEQLPLDLIRP